MLAVVDPGPLLTIQDAGRPGLAGIGVPPSGACDAWGLEVANLLAGAPPGAATVEVTLGGCVLEALETCAVALAGADLGAERDDGRLLACDAVHRLPAGARLRFAGGRGGMRAYVALAGGIAARKVLGSASSYRPGRLGFAAGRPLRPGDRLVPRRRGDLTAVGRAWPASLAPNPGSPNGRVGVVAGPDLAAAPPRALERLVTTAWRVSGAADRAGIRLDGEPLGRGDEIVSHPLVPGSIQLPPDGLPIVLLVDGPTIGGYPVIGVVAAADMPRLGQRRGGDVVRFELVTAEEARARRALQLGFLARAAEELRADDLWSRLAEHANG